MSNPPQSPPHIGQTPSMAPLQPPGTSGTSHHPTAAAAPWGEATKPCSSKIGTTNAARALLELQQLGSEVR